MKSIYVGFVACFSFASAFAEVSLRKLTETTYVCVDKFYSQENSLVYIGKNHVTLVGATWSSESAEALKEAVGNITEKPIEEVINTNYHPDRSGGNHFWKSEGCSIHSTEQTYDLLKSDWEAICDWTRQGLKDYPVVPLALPTHTHKGNFTLQNDKIEVLYLGPSHTEDGVFVYLPDEKILYGGCILKPHLGNLDQANIKEYPNTLYRLKKMNLPIEMIVAGHWRPIHGPELIDHYIALLDLRNKRLEAESGLER